MAVQVQYADPEPNGLATIVGGLIEANVMAHPELERSVAKGGTYGIEAPDVGVAVTIGLAPGIVTIRNGVVGRPQVRITTDSETLVGLSSVPLRLGLPDVMTKEGREVNRKLLKGTLKVDGLVLHAVKLARLNRLLSVV
jgi:hypothetical protein